MTHRVSWWLRLPLIVVAGGVIAATAGVRVNWTPSLPVGFYLVTPFRGTPDRGVIVRACLPSDVAPMAQARGYVGTGWCEGGTMPLLKPAAALPGDIVTVDEGAGVLVNGAPVVPPAQTRDSHGRPLTPLPAGTYPVKPGMVWLLSAHTPASFDSRYFGAVPVALIDATAQPLLTY